MNKLTPLDSSRLNLFTNSKRKNVNFQNPIFASTSLNQPSEQNSELPVNKSSNAKSRLGARKVIDAVTVVSYIAIITSAIAMREFRPRLAKMVDKLIKNKKAVKVSKEAIEEKAKFLTGENLKGGPLYKMFNYFGKLKENSAELTNNLV